MISDCGRTWRSAAVHWGEGLNTDNWCVVGHHFIKEEKNEVDYLYFETDVCGCALYEGWL